MNLKGISRDHASLITDICWVLADHYPECWTNEQLKKTLLTLLECSVGRVLANRCRRDGEEGLVASTIDETADYGHIADWLYAAISNDSSWLQNLDDQGRPKKLMKCRELSDLLREADRDMKKLNQKIQAGLELTDEDEEIIADLGQGFQVIRLLTSKALDLESKRMDHCVGHGAYDAGVIAGLTEIYSLRENGEPRVTIEVCLDDEGRRHLDQVEGYGNSTPDDRYKEVLQEWLITQTWEQMPRCLWAAITDRDVHGFHYQWDSVPSGACVPELHVQSHHVRMLPDDLTVDFMTVEIGDWKWLPDGLTVQTLFLLHEGMDIALPDSLTVTEGGFVRTSGWGDVRVPEHLVEKVGKHFPRPAEIEEEMPEEGGVESLQVRPRRWPLRGLLI